jgi:transposase
MQQYEKEFKQRIVRLHLEEGRTIRSLADEYGICHGSVSNWIKLYREECQINQETKEDYDLMKENRKLRKQLEEARKENEFLKKAAAFFAKEID